MIKSDFHVVHFPQGMSEEQHCLIQPKQYSISIKAGLPCFTCRHCTATLQLLLEAALFCQPTVPLQQFVLAHSLVLSSYCHLENRFPQWKLLQMLSLCQSLSRQHQLCKYETVHITSLFIAKIFWQSCFRMHKTDL